MTPLIIYWTSNTKCTQAMADKLQTSTKHITEYDGESPYILMTPTFGTPKSRIHVPKPVRRFLSTYSPNMVGVIASGNLNFQTEYAIAGDEIAARYHVPMLYRFELRGSRKEAADIDEGVNTHWNKLLAMRGRTTHHKA